SEIALLGAIPLAVLVALLGLAWSGELAPKLLADPGDIVRYGLPVARVVHDGAAALTIGLLVLAVGVLPGPGKVPGAVSYSQWTGTRRAGSAAPVGRPGRRGVARRRDRRRRLHHGQLGRDEPHRPRLLRPGALLRHRHRARAVPRRVHAARRRVVPGLARRADRQPRRGRTRPRP